MRILFISTSNRKKRLYLDPSVRYRCYHFAEAFFDNHIISDICHFESFEQSFINRYDIFIFHKPKYSKRLEALVSRLEDIGKIALADYDDLVFDEKYALQSPLYICKRASLKSVQAMHQEYYQALACFTNITVSTEPLADCVRKLFPCCRVQVVHNGLSASWIVQGNFRFRSNSSARTIGYFPGTSTHQKDFNTIKPVLARLMRKFRDIRLLVLGPVSAKFKGVDADRVTSLDAVTYDQLPYWIMQCSIAVAPLQKSMFNQCKSALKFLETAVWGIPLVASPIPDMERHGRHIHFAENSDQWREQLEFLLEHVDIAAKAKQLKKWCLTNCMAGDQASRLVESIHHFQYRDN